MTFDGLAKSRHPVEKRGPGVRKILRTLDSGFRRNDGKKAFSTFCETITFNFLIFHVFSVILNLATWGPGETFAKGSRKNKFAELAPGFGSDLVAPIEQNHRNSSTISRILRLRRGQR